MFVGRWDHTIDEKGRVTLPASMREPLSPRAYLTKYDGCLAIWSSEKFASVGEVMETRVKNGEVPQQAARAFFASATAVNVDKAGRISVPEHLREYAQLETGGEAVLAGLFSRLELWSPERYAERVGNEESDEELARQLNIAGL